MIEQELREYTESLTKEKREEYKPHIDMLVSCYNALPQRERDALQHFFCEAQPTLKDIIYFFYVVVNKKDVRLPEEKGARNE